MSIYTETGTQVLINDDIFPFSRIDVVTHDAMQRSAKGGSGLPPNQQ